MSARRTNVGLAGLLGAAAATGVAAFGLGTPAGAAVVVAHGVAGLGLLLLSPWKSAIVRRGLRRPRPGRATALALLVTVVVALLTGIAHSAGWRGLPLGLTTMQVHVAAGLGSIVPALVHAVGRPARPRRTDLSRRALLRTGGVVAGAGALWLGAEGAWAVAGTPGSRRRFTGSHAAGAHDPSLMPVTSWLDDRTPALDETAYRLTVATASGAHTLSLAELTAFDDAVTATLDCTGGWFAEQHWSGVRLDRVVDLRGARSVVVVSATGYRRRFGVGQAANLLLATHVAGLPLSAGHGRPLRLVAPGRRGFWWVKWVTEIRTDTRPAWWQSPFPLT